MTGRIRRKNGAVARTALSLLGLGLGSAVFGAVVVGPMIGKKVVAQDKHSGSRTAQPTMADRERLLRDALGLHSGDRVAESSHSADTGSSRVRLTSNEAPSHPRTTSRDAEPDEPAARDETPSPTRAATTRAKQADDDEAPAAKPERETGRTKTASRRNETASDDEEAPRSRTERATDKRGRRAAADDEPSSRPIVAEPAEPRAASTAEARHADRRVTRDDTTASPRKHEGEVRLTEASPAPAADAEPEGAKLYRVRVGKFESREDAEKLRDELKTTAGVTAFLVKVPDGYQVQTGAYKHRSNAEKIAGSLRSHSYRPLVTQE